MKTSLIVPSFNGLSRLQITLGFLINQIVKPFEYILVIDGSNDGTFEWLRMQVLPKNFKLYFQSNKGRAAARNTGISMANGEVLIFVDDDIKVSPDFVKRHLRLQLDYPNSLISGQVLQDLTTSQNSDFCEFRRHQEMKWADQLPSKSHVFQGFNFTTANLSIKKELLLSLGCFNEQLSDGEDLFLGLVADQQSVPILFDPTLVSFHCDYSGIKSYIERSLQYINSKREICKLHPAMALKYGYALQVPSASNPLLKLIRRLLCFNKFWNLFLRSPVFLQLPRFFRFWLYDHIVSSSVYYALLSQHKNLTTLPNEGFQ